MNTGSVNGTQLVWFRNDLRLIDNPALAHASERGSVVAVVTLTPETWQRHDRSKCQSAFWRARLSWLAQQLAALNIPLKVISCERFANVPAALSALCRELSVSALYFNYEYPLDERERDRKVCAALESTGVHCEAFHGDLLIPPGQIVNGQGQPYRVFTPFANRWRLAFAGFDHPLLARPSIQAPLTLKSDSLPDSLIGESNQDFRADLWPVDDDNLLARLHQFCDERESDYATARDFPQPNPAQDATSRLSPYLAIGALSVRQCLHVLRESYRRRGDGHGWLACSWLNELIWREFYRHLLVAYPEMSKLEPFKPEIESRIQWRDEAALFDAWCRGETGFPIVDAAMKQLRETGWMHNRLRMVTASFLTKLLRIDWRYGERFFMAHLIDADFASNLGGWQWSASVGADAAPYFRIFNPQTQGEKFDPDGRFVCHYLPQLVALNGKKRQQPGAEQAAIIDYKNARAETLALYNNVQS